MILTDFFKALDQIGDPRFRSVLFKGGLIKALSTGVFEIGYTRFPANLLWTSVATLAALIALFMLRHHDGFTVDGFRNRRRKS